MSKTAERTHPKLWEKVKARVTRASKGGRAGEWSARKAQLAVQEYKNEGGGYRGKRSADNSLQQWQEEEWGTKSGRKSRTTGERYLPKKARKALTNKEYRRTSEKKRADTRKGKQFSGQPRDIARKTSKYRQSGNKTRSGKRSKAELYALAKQRNVPGRSTMNKTELERAVG